MDVLVLAKIIKLHVMHTDILRFVYFFMLWNKFNYMSKQGA